MKFTLSWLKKHLDTTASLEEICDKLTAIGLEVESAVDPAAKFAAFKVAYVEKAEQHPDADRLRVCQVKTENGTLQVVCGAPNARAGMKAMFAPEGSYIPGLDVVLKKTKIRGAESNGMLVSEKEMQLSEEHNGIIEVDQKFEIGTPMAEIFDLNDPVIEISLTPNRIDCAGVRGIARDLAAAGLGKLKPLDESAVKGKFKSSIGVSITDKDGCPLFLGRMIKGVKNGPSPIWLQQILKSVGLRPISALVDITNYLSMDLCRPLHVFDADKLKGNIIVRETKAGETLAALNDKTYELPAGAVGVCDDSGVLGLGGIMGGTSTSCTEATTNVFVEAAYFNPPRISKTGRALQIDSDARYRFERGIDAAFTVPGMEIATRLILELCGGDVSEVVQAGSVPDMTRVIDFDPAYTKNFIGIDVSAANQKNILAALGFKVAGDKTFKVTPPSWRNDVEGKADLTEEIMRMRGLDSVAPVSVRAADSVPHAAETPLLARARLARGALTSRGMDECVTWSFMGRDLAVEFGVNDNGKLESLTLKNPISSELDVMRPSILPNLINAAGRNHALGNGDVALCEVGPQFSGTRPEDQAIVAAGIRASGRNLRHWADANAARDVDVYDAKADALAALAACGAPSANAQVTRAAPGYYHPGRSGTLSLGKNVLAHFGEIHPGILDGMGIKTAIVGFEVYLQNIPEARKKTGAGKSLLKLEPLQPLSRDFAFTVDQAVEADTLIKAAKATDKNLITDAAIFDVYQGKGVDPGKKSVAFSVTIQPRGTTLTDVEIETLAKKIIESVIAKTGGTLRS